MRWDIHTGIYHLDLVYGAGLDLQEEGRHHMEHEEVETNPEKD